MPTPIGHREDITRRALLVLAAVDLVLAEDTRRTGQLLQHYGLHKPLLSFFEGNERSREEAALAELREGRRVALVSDAGTPLVSDPGFRLVRRAIAEDLAVHPLPGPSAAVTALIGSGLPTDAYYFGGFLPRKPGGRRSLFAELAGLSATLIFYESPHRLLRTLAVLAELFPEREVVVARELTKLHEDFQRGLATDLVQHFTGHPPKGEITLLVAGKSRGKPASE